MKKLAYIFLAVVLLSSFAGRYFSGPSETHDFITYDTVIIYHYDPFHSFTYTLRISRQRTLFTPGSTDTAMRPAIFTMPGVGEMSADTNKLVVYGPHYWLKNGWDGSVVLGNGTHYPILITMICNVSPPQPPIPGNFWVMDYCIKHYHINPRGVHLMGLSEGAFTWSGMIGITDTTGTGQTGVDIGMREVTSLTLLSGAATSSGNYTEFGHWANKYHGRAFLTVGFADAQSPYPPLLAQQMNDSVAGSAFFAYNTVGSGSHCCWNTEYDPNLVLWNSGVVGSTPAGTYVTTSTYPNTQGPYLSPASLFQNALRQGDTTLVGQGTSILTFKEVWTAEYFNGVHASNDTVYTIQAGGNGNYQPFPLPSGELVKTGSPGFNTLRAVSTVGNYYISSAYNAAPTWTKETNDTSGGTLNNVLAVWSFADAAVIQRADSSLWLADNDTLSLIHAPGTRYIITKPIKMSANGVKYVKVDIGLNGIYGLTSDGNLDLWATNSQSLTPARVYSRATAGGMMDVTTCSSDMVVGIIRNASGDTTSGNVYAKGASWGDVGGTSVTYSVFTNIMPLLGLTAGTAKRVSMSSNAFHVINTSGQLFGVAKCNSQGELGNGTEQVNKYTYPTYPGIGWTFSSTENPFAAPMVLVGGSTVFTDIYDNKWFTFYKFAKDNQGNLYSWGRGKTGVLGNGLLLNPGDSSNQFHSNAVDVLVPTKVNPLTAIYQTVHFVTPFGATAGSNQSIGATSTTIGAGGTPISLTLVGTPTDTILYHIVAYSWIKTAGTGGTITCPTCRNTTVTGLTNGTYHYQVTETDNNTGQDTAGVTIVVSIAPPSVSAGSNQSINASNTTLTGTATAGSGATITSTTWTCTATPPGAAAPMILTPNNSLTTAVTGLISGVYTFQLSATDSNGNSANATMTVTVTGIALPANHLSMKVKVLMRM